MKPKVTWVLSIQTKLTEKTRRNGNWISSRKKPETTAETKVSYSLPLIASFALCARLNGPEEEHTEHTSTPAEETLEDLIFTDMEKCPHLLWGQSWLWKARQKESWAMLVSLWRGGENFTSDVQNIAWELDSALLLLQARQYHHPTKRTFNWNTLKVSSLLLTHCFRFWRSLGFPFCPWEVCGNHETEKGASNSQKLQIRTTDNNPSVIFHF